jgi:WD40 repeat protein
VSAHEQRLRKTALLEQRAEVWTSTGGTDDLLRGQALDDAHELAATSPMMATFVAASHSAQLTEHRRRSSVVAGRARQVHDRDPQRALAVALAAVTEFEPSPAAVLTLWAMVTEPEITRMALGHTDTVLALAWQPGRDRLVSVSRDASVCTWDTAANLVDFATLPASVAEVVLSPDGSRLQVRERDDRNSLWHTAGLELIGHRSASPYDPIGHYCWSPDGREFIEVDHTDATIWSLFEPRDGPRLVSRTFPVWMLSSPTWSPDGSRIALLHEERITVVDATTGTEVGTIAVDAEPTSLTWSPDGQRFAVIQIPRTKKTFDVGNARASIVVYDLAGRVHARRKRRGAMRIAWSPSRTMLAVLVHDSGSEDRIELWDPDTLSPGTSGR